MFLIVEEAKETGLDISKKKNGYSIIILFYFNTVLIWNDSV